MSKHAKTTNKRDNILWIQRGWGQGVGTQYPGKSLVAIEILVWTLHQKLIVVLTVILSPSHWYPWSGVVLDCIDA